jgi:triosephosphate isomerase
MHGTRASVESLLQGLLDGLSAPAADVAVCPSHVHLAQARALCAGSPVAVGAQDCSHMAEGAFTGDVSALMLADLGCALVLIGHSERRQYQLESDQLLAAKLAAAVRAGLQPVLCVGETLEERENGDAESVVSRQLHGALGDQASLQGLVVAYEPVWAIGTGLTATPDQAQDMHAFIRAELETVAGLDPQATRILYGGSVKSGNAAQLFAQADIDGALVGGAALDAAEFRKIIDAAG